MAEVSVGQRQPTGDPLADRMADYLSKKDSRASFKGSEDINPFAGTYPSRAQPEETFLSPLALTLEPLPTENPEKDNLSGSDAPSRVLPSVKPVPSVKVAPGPSPTRGKSPVDSEPKRGRSRWGEPAQLSDAVKMFFPTGAPASSGEGEILPCGCRTQNCVLGIFQIKKLSKAAKQVSYLQIIIFWGRHRFLPSRPGFDS